MLYEKEIAHDLRNFQKLCKEKRQLLLQTYANEEKELNEVYAKNYKELLKSHKKQLDNLHTKVEKRKRKLRKNIECELRSEKKNLKKLYNRKSQSINHVMQSIDYPVSSISLNNLPTTIHSNNNDNDNQSLNTSLQLPITSSSSTSLNQLRNHVIRKPKQLYSLNKQLSKSDYTLNNAKNDSVIFDYENNLQNLNDELEERFYHCSMDAKNSIAELEWKCLLERQQLKRTYLHNLGELKQRRIMSLANLTRIQTKTYYDLQRKWLCQLHTHELNLRNTSCQETLKKLTDSQTIERQTICKLLNESIKGQKQIIQILENLLKNDKQLNKTESTLLSMNHTTHNTTHNLLSTINEQQISTSLLEQLMESPYFVIEEYSSDDFTEGITKHQSTPTSLTNVDNSLNDNNHIIQLKDTTNEIDYPLKQSTSHSLPSKIIELSNSNQHEKQQSNELISRVKSTQSIHSTISAYESLSRTVLNIITTRQSDFWTSILEQEHFINRESIERTNRTIEIVNNK
ncbi:centrosomal protein [Schistosoma japonicum]|nr:centrosomal protein [Schistosoma japonicum]